MPRAYPLLLFHATATPVRYTLSLHDALPISVTALALRLAPLVFVRPGELRAAEWSEFDLANAEWRIPANRMKMAEQHIVPLAHQALAILRELEPLARRGRYVFPSLLSRDRPMSNNTINTALRR